MTKRVHEYLIKAGAFDSLGDTRSYLLSEFESIIDSYSDDLKRNVEGQINLFGDDEESFLGTTPKVIPELSQKELLKFDKESIGYYISGHPLKEFEKEIEEISTVSFADFIDDENLQSNIFDGMPVTVCALASGIKTKVTKNNKIMAFVTAEDLTHQAEIIVFPNVYDRSRKYLTEDAPLVISGKLSFREDEEPKILCDMIEPLTHESKPNKVVLPKASSELKSDKKLYLKFAVGKDYLLEKVIPILSSHNGNVPVYTYSEEKKQTALAPRNMWVMATDDLLEELKKILGDKNVVLK